MDSCDRRRFVASYMDQMTRGYETLVLLLFLEAIGFPIPGSLVLLTAGAAAATGVLHPAATIGFSLLAMLCGDTLLYVVGRYTGWALLGFLCRISLNPESCILQAAESFYKRGRKALLFAKFIPGINTMSPPLAGSMNMHPVTFLALDSCGALFYTMAFFVPGFLFSELLKDIMRGMQAFGTLLEWVIGIGLAIYIGYRIRIAWSARKLPDAPPMEVMSVAKLTEGEDTENLLIGDVRSHGYYDKGAMRIRGSVRLDPNALTSELNELPKHKKLFLYCTCYREATSARVANILIERGYEAYVIVGGLKAWQKAGLPLEPVPEDDIVLLPSFRRD